MGTLYVVGTPIGNIKDISLRALETLNSASLIAAEDTRTTRKLLAHYDIHTPLTSYFEHNRLQRQEQILAALAGGDVALVSDSGTPTISDPGYHLVGLAADHGYPVVPVPGANAAVAAVAVSALPTDAFTFVGFLPRPRGRRRQRLGEIAALPHTVVLYESPHRVSECLADMLEVLGDRRVSVSRELTKVHEETWRGTLEEAVERFAGPQRGEFTLVVEGRPQEEWPADRIRRALRQLRGDGLGLREAARQVADVSGWSKPDVYRLGLTDDPSPPPPVVSNSDWEDQQ